MRRENFTVKGGARFLDTEVIMESCRNPTCSFHNSVIKPRYPRMWYTANCPECGWGLYGGDLIEDEHERVLYHIKT